MAAPPSSLYRTLFARHIVLFRLTQSVTCCCCCCCYCRHSRFFLFVLYLCTDWCCKNIVKTRLQWCRLKSIRWFFTLPAGHEYGVKLCVRWRRKTASERRNSCIPTSDMCRAESKVTFIRRFRGYERRSIIYLYTYSYVTVYNELENGSYDVISRWF